MRKLRQKVLYSVLILSMWGFFISVALLVILKHNQLLLSYFFTSTDGDIAITRNLLLMMTALIALPLAIHRTVIADKQLRESEKQNRDRDFQNWIVNFFSSNEGMKYVAVEELWNFAQKYPEDYHVKVMRLFCNFIRNYSDCDKVSSIKLIKSKGEKKDNQTDDDLPVRMKFIREKHFNNILSMVVNKGGNQKSGKQIRQERDEGYRIDLSGTNFALVDLSNGDLTNADLRWTFWFETNVEKTKWEKCCISKALFWGHEETLNLFKEIEGNPISTPEMREIYLAENFSTNDVEEYLNEQGVLESRKIKIKEWLSAKKEEANILKPLPKPSS